MIRCFLTTVDNPYSPYEQFEDWYRFDTDKGYNSSGLLMRMAYTSDQLTDTENAYEIEQATDFDGVERTETFRFNLTEAELQAWELSVEGGMRKRMESIMAAKDTKQIAELFQEIIDRSYGCKSADGRRFVKSPELLAEFKSMQAYSDLYMTLATDAAAATEFVNGLVPKTSIAANAAQTAADTANTPILMSAT